MEKEQALAKLLLLEARLVKEANSIRGESKKTTKEYEKALAEVCNMLGADQKIVENIVNP